MPRYDVDRHVVFRPAHALTPWMPGLAVAIAARFAFEPGEMFLADFCALVMYDTFVFPEDLSDAGRRMRVERLLWPPVQVDDLVLHLEVDEQRTTYQKTKRIICRHGNLATEATPVPETPAAVSTYVDPRVAARPDDAAALLARVQSLEATVVGMRAYLLQRMGTVEDLLAADGLSPNILESHTNAKSLAAEMQRLNGIMERYELDLAAVSYRQREIEKHLGIETRGMYNDGNLG